MGRERIRRLAAEKAGVRTSGFAFVDDLPSARRAARELGFPCVFKAMMSSSGHGMTVVRGEEGVPEAYAEASERGRVANARVMIEEFIPFDREVTMLTLRHYDPSGHVATTVMDPVAHVRPGTLYHESWQPEVFPSEVGAALRSTATAVTDQLGGLGIFGVECFVRGSSVYFSEVSPRPHDTGLVTLGSQWNSEFALHARAILGLPYVGPEPSNPAAAHVILGDASGWSPSFGGLSTALGVPGVRVFLFGKPETYRDRRLGVAVARAENTGAARALAESAAHRIEAELKVDSPKATGGHP